MPKFHTIEATFRVVTPMFLGGADQQATRIRASSVKGALVFWWRALVFSRIVEAKGGDHVAALRELRRREIDLFGGADRNAGQSEVRVVVTRMTLPEPLTPPSNNFSTDLELSNQEKKEREEFKQEHKLTMDGQPGGKQIGSGVGYLGYGLLAALRSQKRPPGPPPQPVVDIVVPGELERSCFFHRMSDGRNVEFTIRLLSKRPFSNEVHDAIKLLGLLGGLGARVRRGWGNVALIAMKVDGQKPNDWSPPSELGEYTTVIKTLLQPAVSVAYAGDTWPVTAFSPETRLDVTNWAESDPLTVMDKLGRGMQRYRSWGFRRDRAKWPMVNGKPSEKNFEVDHDWFHGIGRFARRKGGKGGRGRYAPERTGFGLPTVYRKNFEVSGDGDIVRRASPLMLHVHPVRCDQTGKERFVGVAVLLPTQFLPEPHISVKAGSTWQADYDFHNNPGGRDGLTVLTGLLDGRGTKGRTGPTRYIDATTILP